MKKNGIRSEKYYSRKEMRKKSARMIKGGWKVCDVETKQESLGCCLFPLGYFLPKKDVWYVTYEA